MSCRRDEAPKGWNCWEHSCNSCPYNGVEIKVNSKGNRM